jgi:hypothetical protein
MIVMPSNNTGRKIRELWRKYPLRMGMMHAPHSWKNGDVPYALDNGRYAATTKGKKWEERKFERICQVAKEYERDPMFVVVPDVVGDCEETLKEWDRWTTSSWLIDFGFELAFVAQDGCTPEDIPDNADWVFIGGTPDWKTGNIYRFCKAHPKVHVGGINTGRKLWICHKSGAKSCDGTGWTRGDPNQWIQLRQYLYRSEHGLGDGQQMLFNLYEADAMGAKFHQETIDEIKQRLIHSSQSKKEK